MSILHTRRSHCESATRIGDRGICLYSGLAALILAALCSCGSPSVTPTPAGVVVVKTAADIVSIREGQTVHIESADASIIDEVLAGRQLRVLVVRYVDLDQSSYTSTGLERLEYLEFESCEGLGEEEGSWLASFPTLRSLRVRECVVSPAFWSEMVRSKSLQDIAITGRDSVPKGAVPDFRSLARLTDLYLGEIIMTQEWVTGLEKAMALKELTCARCTLISGVDVSVVLSLPSLTSIQFVDCRGVTDDTFRPLVGKMSIEYINFSGTRGVSEAFVEELQQSNPDVRIGGR